MFRTIQEFFRDRVAAGLEAPEAESSEHALRVATAALLVELTRADFEVTEEERAAVDRQIREAFGLDEEEAAEILRLAEEEADRAISLYEFTRLVDRSFTPEQKRYVVELLWRVAFADGRADEHEEYSIRKIAKLLHVPHEEFIAAKRRARADG